MGDHLDLWTSQGCINFLSEVLMVDTASEMEELDVDSISLMPEPGSQGTAKLQVFLARYSYNPFDGPNENPEAELPLTAGEYIYIYGDMDEDGFFEGELMDGRRGLVPSNFVERVSDDDLMTVLPSELNDLTHSSYQEKSFVSASTSSGDKSDFSIEESSISPLVSRAEGDQEERVSHTAVPYPRKLTLIKQLARSIVVGWEPPLLPAGCPDIQSYNIYVDEELRQNVKSGFQTKAVIEKLDLKTKAYRVSVQSVTEKGSSDKLRCTFFVGQHLCVAPTMLKVRNVTATSAEVTWLPCNSNYNHAVYLNGEECDITKPGVYWYTFRNLQPSTQYVAKLEARPLKTLWEEVSEGQEQNSAVIHFSTPLAGTPDAPLDVQIEVGPSPGILVISWLPVTIDAEGSSNGVRVTGYAVYADGQKAIEVTSPTAGSVLVDLSQLQMFQMCQEVSVRTMSLYGESVDSVPAQISSVLLRASRHSSPSDSAVCTTFTSRLPCGESRGSLPARSPPTHQTAALLLRQKVPTDSSDAKLTDLSSSHVGSARSLPEKASSLLQLSSSSTSLVHTSSAPVQGSDTTQEKKCLTVPPQQAGSTKLPSEGTEPISIREAESKSLGEGTEVLKSVHLEGSGAVVILVILVMNTFFVFVSKMEQFVTKMPELESPTNSSLKIHVETCHTCSVEESPKNPSAERQTEAKEKNLSPEPLPSPSRVEGMESTSQDAGLGGSSCQEFLRLSPGKEMMKEMSRVKREQEEKMSEIGRRQLTLFAEHNRSSDLSDILEEEEEDELSSEALDEKKWDPREPCYRENGEKPTVATPHRCAGRESAVTLSHFLMFISSLFFLCLSWLVAFLGGWVQMDLCDTDSDEEILERILELPLQKNHSKKLFSIPEVTEDEDEDEDEKSVTEEKKHPQDCLGAPTYAAGRSEKTLSAQDPFPKADGSDYSPDLSAQTPREEQTAKESRGGADHVSPSWSQKRANWNLGYQENDPKSGSGTSPTQSKKKGNNYREKIWGRPEMGRKGQNDFPEHCSRLLGNCSQMGGGLYRAPSLREELNIVSSSAEKEGFDVYTRARQSASRRNHRKAVVSGFSEPAGMGAHCSSSSSLEIDIEYDSEDDQDSTCSSPPESRLWPEGAQNCQGEWGDCSSQSEVIHTDGRRHLTRLERVEEQGMDWAGSSSRRLRSFCQEKEALRCESSSEEQGWDQDCPPRGSASETSVEDDGIRIFVALFDYDPVSMSPNPDAAEEELPFKEGQILKVRNPSSTPLVIIVLFCSLQAELAFSAGDIITVFGSMDDDGFYYGELNQQRGLVPSNFLEAVTSDDNMVEELHSKDKDALLLSAESQ
ncbi:hypothetical protein ASZ78_007966, partial [Callipepla squamata]